MQGQPRATLSVLDGVAVLVGVVVGIGIFGLPPLVAANVGSGFVYMLLWLAGGVVMLIGAVCYAELGSAYPGTGGEYHFLSRAFGPHVGLLFAWARGTVIQTGAIAAVAFIYGEYAQRLWSLGAHGEAWHAALAVVALTGLNLLGTPQSKRLQVVFTTVAVSAVLMVSIGGLLGSAATGGGAEALGGTPPEPWVPSAGALGMGMVFVLLTYGGWNEVAYLSGELRDARRDMSRILLLGTALVVALYLVVNLAYLGVFGLLGLRETQAVGAELMFIVAGPAGAVLLSLLVCCTALSTINGSILTGARVYYALGRDVIGLRGLGAWNERGSTPGPALLLQGAITLGLIAVGAAGDGRAIQTMVAYTAPVFWLFMLLVGAALVVLRWRDPDRPRPFRAPLYPVPPLLFCLTCAGLFYSSARYAGEGALWGLAVLVAGLPFLLFYRPRTRRGNGPARGRTAVPAPEE